MLAPGTKAPNFRLPDQNGNTLSLSDFKGKQAVVLFFYPKDDTPGCKAESCSFRDSYFNFRQHNSEVIGISSDSIESHDAFAKKHNLPYPILSDVNNQVKALYDVKNTLGILPGRATFVVDKEGIIRHAFSSQILISRHASDALQVVRHLVKEDQTSEAKQVAP